jgi:hypothetical protein
VVRWVGDGGCGVSLPHRGAPAMATDGKVNSDSGKILRAAEGVVFC